MNILLTGCASRLAATCLPMLLDDARVHQIIGVDIKASSISHGNYREHLIDIRSNDLARYFVDIDAVIHFAFAGNTGSLGRQRFDREYIRNVNVDGSKRVFDLAAEHGVTTLIHLSSAIVYGMDDNNPAFISEEQGLKPVTGFYYSEDKVAVEQLLDEYEREQSQVRVVRLRPHVILGQHPQRLVKTLLSWPYYFSLDDPQPLMQCISEVDVATALIQALFLDVHGSYNLATDQVASLHLVQKHLHNFTLPLPFGLVKQLHSLAWRFTGRYGDPGWIYCLPHSLTIDNEKAKHDLQWAPTLNLFECLDATI